MSTITPWTGDPETALRWLPEVVDRIVKRFDPLRIILFGSFARGDARRWSDIDLLVVLSNVPDRRETTIDILRSLSDSPIPVDVIVTDPDQIALRGNQIGTVRRPALRDGKVIYEHLSGTDASGIQGAQGNTVPCVVAGSALRARDSSPYGAVLAERSRLKPTETTNEPLGTPAHFSGLRIVSAGLEPGATSALWRGENLP